MHQSERVRQSAADCDYICLSISSLPTRIDRIALLQCEGLPSSPDGAPTFRVGPSSSPAAAAQFILESDGTQLEPSRQIIFYYKYHTAHPLPPSWAAHITTFYARPQQQNYPLISSRRYPTTCLCRENTHSVVDGGPKCIW